MIDPPPGEYDPARLILWRDEHLLVANKPAGLPTLVDGYHPQSPYLLGLLEQLYNPLWVIHRLDKETSGVILFARTASAHRSLNIQFEQRQTQKIYHALVQGVPEWQNRVVQLPLRPDGDRRHRTLVDPGGGKPSETELLVMERWQGFSLVQALPRTGRTHQIRAHLAALGHPIAGDGLYGGVPLEGLGRMGLHANSIQFRHPASAEEIEFLAPYPQELEQIIRILRGSPAS